MKASKNQSYTLPGIFNPEVTELYVGLKFDVTYKCYELPTSFVQLNLIT